MPLPDAAQTSLDRIFKSGDYVCRPHRQIFVEHTFTNSRGEITRQVTPADLRLIAENGNRKAAETGDLAPIGLGHTLDDVLDDQGNVLKKFSESEQPPPIGYLHNYSVEILPTGKWALFADEWIQKVLPNERGEMVDGVQYAGTYPRRSAEYFPTKKFIDWLALLRRAPALDMGLDIYQYANLFPEKVHYEYGTDGASLLGAVEDTKGKWRYAANYAESEEKEMPDNPTSGNPAAPPDDRPPIPAAPQAGPGELPDLHKTAAEHYAMHSLGMHHTHAKALLNHAHSMYGAALGLPADKVTPHTPAPAMPAAPATPGAIGAPPSTPAAPAPPAAPHVQHSPVGLQGDSSWQHGGTPPGTGAPPHHKPEHEKHNAAATGPSVPGGGNAYIPGTEEERRRMSAVQQGIQHHQFSSDLERERHARQQLEARIATMEKDTRSANYERDLTGLLGMGYQFDLAKEMGRAEKWNYAADRCTEQLTCIKENYARPTDGDRGPVWLYGHDGSPQRGLPSRDRGPADPEGVTYEIAQEARKYAAKHKCDFDEAVAKVKEKKGVA